MIADSWPWKAEIARRALRLRQRTRQRRWHERSFVGVEKDLFLSAYAVRKLVEAGKLSDELESTVISAKKFGPPGKAVGRLSVNRVEELYDLSQPASEGLLLVPFCNQIIHSFIFQICLGPDGDGLVGFYVASDRYRRTGLLYFEIEQVISLLLEVSEDDIVLTEMKRNPRSGEMEYARKSRFGKVETR